MKTFNSREQALRAEFKAQQDGGVPNYHLWLEQKLISMESEKAMIEMAAEKNYELWQAAESRCERLTWGDGGH